MITIKNVNPAQAYLEGMLWAAYGVKVISGPVAEWQIDKVKESALKYTSYGFEKHVGYGTSAHIKAIKEFGLCEEHRLSFERRKKTSPLFFRFFTES